MQEQIQMTTFIVLQFWERITPDYANASNSIIARYPNKVDEMFD